MTNTEWQYEYCSGEEDDEENLSKQNFVNFKLVHNSTSTGPEPLIR